MYIVADINLNADHDDNLELKGAFRFEITIKD